MTPPGGSGGSSPRDDTATNRPWFSCLPGCETEVPCGTGRHTVCWEAGSLRLPSHADAEGELVLAALGGEKARCVEVAEAWARHADDLSVLAIGPRDPGDEIAVSWDDVAAAAQANLGPRPASLPGLGGQPRPRPLASPPGPTMARVAARHRQIQEEALAAQRRRNDILSLLALGYGFQVRLIGQVAATHAVRLEGRDGSADHGGTTPLAPPEGGEQVRPALVAAITGRLAPVAEEWLGIDPANRVRSGPPAAGQPARRMAGFGLGLRAGPGRTAPDRQGGTAGLANGARARRARARRRTRAAGRARRPGRSRQCPTLGGMSRGRQSGKAVRQERPEASGTSRAPGGERG